MGGSPTLWRSPVWRSSPPRASSRRACSWRGRARRSRDKDRPSRQTRHLLAQITKERRVPRGPLRKAGADTPAELTIPLAIARDEGIERLAGGFRVGVALAFTAVRE